MNEIQEGLNQREKDDGAFFCSYLSFMEGYRYVQRVIERSGQSAYLLLCTMTDGKGVPLEKGERLGKVAEELEQASVILSGAGICLPDTVIISS